MNTNDKTLDEIEETQAELRESIETAKDLAEKSDKLIKKHRRKIKADTSPPAGGTAAR